MASEPLVVTPTHLWSKPSQIHKFTVDGGIPPIAWQTKSGEVSASEDEANVFIYQAPRRYMQDTILFFDRAGQEISVTIDVLRPLQITPNVRNIPTNNNGYFRVQGGSGKWQVEDNEVLTITKSGMKLLITTGNSAGSYSVRVHDKVTKEQVEAQVRIYKPLEVREQ